MATSSTSVITLHPSLCLLILEVIPQKEKSLDLLLELRPNPVRNLLSSGVTASSTTLSWNLPLVSTPGIIVVKEVTCRSIRIAWAPVSGTFNNYVFGISPPTTAGVDSDLITKASGQLERTYTDLEPGVAYTITLLVIQNNINVQQSIVQRTLPNVPSSLNVESTTAVSVVLTWTAVVTSGVYDGYRIRYGDNQVKDVADDVLTTVIDLLNPDTSYTFEVLALSGSEESNPETCPSDNNIRAIASTTTVALAPAQVVCKEVTIITLVLVWGPVNQDNVVYTLIRNPPEGFIEYDNAAYTATVRNLTPGKEYCFFIRATYGSTTEEGDPVCKRTIPDHPGIVTVPAQQARPTCFQVTWLPLPATSVYSTYRIQVTDQLTGSSQWIISPTSPVTACQLNPSFNVHCVCGNCQWTA
ncbi:receptor-type tyrosine-protein phosphatase eta-like [Amphiura filiformis]|uniref:receptor-type tyrosine-protein phosphatase eta-like n=1 Tax=Amphiura filiformis TaxID=82378 RepID=UPI003B21AB52